MELRHLRYFLAAADSGSFSAASRSLHVAQSAISEQIADLERELGGPLLERGQRRLRLTAPGEIFLQEARRILESSERAVELTRRSMRGQVGTLSIGFFLWGSGGFFPRIIREYRKLNPGVRLSLSEMPAPAQMEALLSGKIDVGFTRPLEPPLTRFLHEELLYQDPIVAVLPRSHRLAGSRKIQLADLAGEPFVINDRANAPRLHDNILALCASAGFSPHVVNASAMWSGVLTLVESGEGIALVPSGVRHLRTRDLAFCELLPHTSYVGLALAWNPEHASPIQQGFLRLVRDNKHRITASAWR